MNSLLDALLQSLTAAAKINRSVLATPGVLLWTDADCQWTLFCLGYGRRFPVC